MLKQRLKENILLRQFLMHWYLYIRRLAENDHKNTKILKIKNDLHKYNATKIQKEAKKSPLKSKTFQAIVINFTKIFLFQIFKPTDVYYKRKLLMFSSSIAKKDAN